MATTYNVPTEETLKALVTAVQAIADGTNVHGGHVYFYSSKPAESDVPDRPALVVVTGTGEIYLVTDSSSAKANAWSGEEEDSDGAATVASES